VPGIAVAISYLGLVGRKKNSIYARRSGKGYRCLVNLTRVSSQTFTSGVNVVGAAKARARDSNTGACEKRRQARASGSMTKASLVVGGKTAVAGGCA
jgi:hypothetical protein